MTRHRTLLFATIAASAVAAGTLATPARADVVDPQIFIQQSGTAPANGPNLITNTGSFVVGVAGNFTLQNPLLVIVGVLNDNGSPTISFNGSNTPAASVGTYGLTANTGTFTSSSTGDAFAQLGISAGGSENWTNWSGYDSAHGFGTATSYSLYAFALSTSLTSGSPITIDQNGAANGSFIIAYDCENGTGSTTGCAKAGDIGQTVFTNTGVLHAPPMDAPEPGSLALLGTGLIGLGLVGWRYRRRIG